MHTSAAERAAESLGLPASSSSRGQLGWLVWCAGSAGGRSLVLSSPVVAAAAVAAALAPDSQKPFVSPGRQGSLGSKLSLLTFTCARARKMLIHLAQADPERTPPRGRGGLAFAKRASGTFENSGRQMELAGPIESSGGVSFALANRRPRSLSAEEPARLCSPAGSSLAYAIRLLCQAAPAR